MFKAVVAVSVLVSSSAFAEDVSYGKCREIVSMTDLVLGAQSECGFGLTSESSDLYKECSDRLSPLHAEAARINAANVSGQIKSKTGENFCREVRRIFSPIISK